MINGLWRELTEIQRLIKIFAIQNEYLYMENYYVNPISEIPYSDTDEVHEALVNDLLSKLSISNAEKGDYYKGLYANTNYPNNQLIVIEEFGDQYLLIDIWHSDDEDGYGANVYTLKEGWQKVIEVNDSDREEHQ